MCYVYDSKCSRSSITRYPCTLRHSHVAHLRLRLYYLFLVSALIVAPIHVDDGLVEIWHDLPHVAQDRQHHHAHLKRERPREMKDDGERERNRFGRGGRVLCGQFAQWTSAAIGQKERTQKNVSQQMAKSFRIAKRQTLFFWA